MTEENLHYEIQALMGKGMGLSALAQELRTRGIRTVNGKEWKPANLAQLIKRKGLKPHSPSATQIPPAAPFHNGSATSKVLRDLLSLDYLNDSQRIRMLNAYFESAAA